MSDAGFELLSLIQAHRAESLGPFLRRLARASVATGAITLAACSGTAVDTDAGPRLDAHVGSDGGTDGGPADAGPGDAGQDAGPADAGPMDSGPADAGPTDAGPTDAGQDAGLDGGESWLPTRCSDDGWEAAQGLSPDLVVDYLDVMDNSFGGALVLDSAGTACITASDGTACRMTLDALAPFGRSVRTTQGDTVQAHSTDEELMALLGTIDTPEEAVLRVWHQGYNVLCDDTARGAVREVDGHYEVRATRMTSSCDPIITNLYELEVMNDGTVTVLSEVEIDRTPGACVGRRPEGLQDAPLSRDLTVGAWLSEIAFLEASAVHAFDVLADELTHLGAPAELVRDARAASEDEVRHAQIMASAAARYGHRTPTPQVEPQARRTAFAMAMDNATEGCVRETFGALIGHHQALAATDPALREAMAEIAEDETRHATLSWRIARWLEPQLTDDERQQVRDAQQEAVQILREEMAHASLPGIARTVGMPSPDEAVALVDRMSDAIWN